MGAFRIGAEDGEFLAKQFEPVFDASDLLNIDNYRAYLKLLVEGQSARPFNIATLPFQKGDINFGKEAALLSLARYGRLRTQVEEEINKNLIHKNKNGWFQKNDLFLALAIGFFSALMLVFVGGNLSGENKFFEIMMPYANYLFLIFLWFAEAGLLSPTLSQKLPGHTLYQFGKFFLVGGFNFLLDATILNFFLVATKLTAGLPQTGFKGCSFVLGIVSSYLLNKHWTFSADAKKTPKRNYSFCFYKPHRFYAEYRPGLCFRQYGRQFLEYETDSLGAIFRRDGGGNNYVLEFPRLQIHRL